MFQVLHRSEADKLFSRDQLGPLLAASRTRNAAADLTGMLVFAQNHFLQVLEGPADNVVDTFARIERDSRHRNIVTLFRGHAPAGHCFAEWAMGFHLIASHHDMPRGFIRVNDRIDLTQSITSLRWNSCRRANEADHLQSLGSSQMRPLRSIGKPSSRYCRIAASRRSGRKGFCKNTVPCGIDLTRSPDIKMMLSRGYFARA
jgi:hypothetical protein